MDRPRKSVMHASAPVAESPPDLSFTPPTGPGDEAGTQRAIRDLIEMLPEDVLEDLNRGIIDLKDPAFLDGLMDHVSRLSLASPRNGQKILGKIIKLKKLIARNLRKS